MIISRKKRKRNREKSIKTIVFSGCLFTFLHIRYATGFSLCRKEPGDFLKKGLTQGQNYGILSLANLRRCGGMVDTGDLKSPGSNTVPVRVRSPAPFPVQTKYRGVEQLVARRAHNPEVRGSSPLSATRKSNSLPLGGCCFLFWKTGLCFAHGLQPHL